MADQVHRASDPATGVKWAHVKWLTARTSEEVNGEQRRKAPHRVQSSHHCWQRHLCYVFFRSVGHIGGDVAMPQAVVMVECADDIVIGFDSAMSRPALPV